MSEDRQGVFVMTHCAKEGRMGDAWCASCLNHGELLRVMQYLATEGLVEGGRVLIARKAVEDSCTVAPKDGSTP